MKKYDNFFRMGQVAEICGVTRRMILNYEELELIEPALTDPVSGYRYFDILSISRIQVILDLRDAGMSLPDIGRYLRGELTAEEQEHKLLAQREHIERSIADLRIRNVHDDVMTVQKVRLTACLCVCRDFVSETVESALSAFVNLYHDCLNRSLSIDSHTYNFNIFPVDLTSDSYFETENIRMTSCISVNKKTAPEDAVLFPACDALSVSFRGTLENSRRAYDMLRNALLAGDFKQAGFPRELYLEGNYTDPDNRFVIQVVVPVEPIIAKVDSSVI